MEINSNSTADDAYTEYQKEKNSSVKKEEGVVVFMDPDSEITPELKAAHTPLPWKAGYGYIWGPEMEMIADSETEEEAYVLRMRGVGGNLPIAANHAFIVQACNSHEALVKVIHEYRAHHDALWRQGEIKRGTECPCGRCIHARAALEGNQ